MRTIVASLSLLLLALPTTRADDQDVKPVTIPFELLATNHMAIQIKINGKGPYRVIFDTGAPVSLLNNKTAKASGVISKNASTSFLGMLAGPSQTKIPSLELGDLKAKDVPVIVMDHPTVEIMSKILGPVEGILGFPFFARYRMTLDYKAKELTFVPNGFKPTDTLEAMMNTVMMMEAPPKKILSPVGVWGVVVSKAADDEEAGVTIAQVYANSAAEKAGLKKGDRLLTLDDRWTDTVLDLYQAASLVTAGSDIKLTIKRDGVESEKMLKPAPGL